MTFIIKNQSSNKVIKNAITLKPFVYESAEEAQKFADSMAANNRVDHTRKGAKLARFEVVAQN